MKKSFFTRQQGKHFFEITIMDEFAASGAYKGLVGKNEMMSL